MRNTIFSSLISLKDYCESEDFAGWDPYDGLNSKVFKATPLKNWDIARLAWIQGFKRSPINFRKLLLVPKEHNAKGIGLFLSGYCNIYKLQQISGNDQFDSQQKMLDKINYLSNILLSMQSKGYSGACWGYNFDWQARRSFLFPIGTPTVVATTFCATALLDSYEITKNEKYLETALSSAEFVVNDLTRHQCEKGFLFSYSPLDGNNTVFNASLLGSKLLSLIYKYTKNENYLELAKESIVACCDNQFKDGSWIYGLKATQNWIDSFHTGYNLDALITYKNISGDKSINENIDKGFHFYINNFFLDDGTPKYYHNKIYPIDIHCPGQLFITLSKMMKFEQYKTLASKVLDWTIGNMQDKNGYFYYQLKKGISSKISYMRWSNAFMFNALSYYLLEELKINDNFNN